MAQKLALLGKFKIFVVSQNIIPFLKVALNSKFLICILIFIELMHINFYNKYKYFLQVVLRYA